MSNRLMNSITSATEPSFTDYDMWFETGTNKTYRSNGSRWIEVLAFPDNANEGDLYTFKTRTWRFDGNRWRTHMDSSMSMNMGDITIDADVATKSGLQIMSNDEMMASLYWDMDDSAWMAEHGDTSKKVLLEGDVVDTAISSIGLTVPQGLSVSNTPLTQSGIINIDLETGYSIPQISRQLN